jgi:hypothetical protein
MFQRTIPGKRYGVIQDDLRSLNALTAFGWGCAQAEKKIEVT